MMKVVTDVKHSVILRAYFKGNDMNVYVLNVLFCVAACKARAEGTTCGFSFLSVVQTERRLHYLIYSQAISSNWDLRRCFPRALGYRKMVV